jgi:hypothetical protein
MERCDTGPNTSAGGSKCSQATCDEISAPRRGNVYIEQTKAPAIGRRSLEDPHAVAPLAEPSPYCAVKFLPRMYRAEWGSVQVSYAIVSAIGSPHRP